MNLRRARGWLPLAALWAVLAAGLAAVTSQVADWYVMTDELLYERLALGISQLHSPLPHIHDELIGNVNQLYPLLLAPLFHDVLVPSGSVAMLTKRSVRPMSASATV